MLRIFSSLLVLSSWVFSFDFVSNNLQYRYGSDDHYRQAEGISGTTLQILTYENLFASKEWESFLFIDTAKASYSDRDNYRFYGEWNPRVSLGKQTGLLTGNGLVKDVFLTAQYNKGKEYRALLGGVGAQFNIPHFHVLGIDFMKRDDNYNKPNYQTTLYWNSLWEMASLPWEVSGFCDYVNNPKNLRIELNILMKGKSLSPMLKNISAGVKTLYYDKSSYKGTLPQFMVKYTW